MIFIENEGALFRGPSRGNPKEVWSRKSGIWKPYAGGPKAIDWGYEISEEKARKMMAESPGE